MTTTDPAAARPVPFDPELAAALDVLLAEMPGDVTLETLDERRAVMATRAVPLEEVTGDGLLEITEHSAPGPNGPVPLLVGRPTDAPPDLPVLYFLHGGGMIFGGNRGRELFILREWALDVGLAFVSADYRVAPEHPHPAPVEDCYAGLLWTVEHAADPDRVVIGGGSAGGGLAAATALLARDRGGPSLLGQLLLCPMLDDRNDTPSAHQMAGLGIWDRAMNELGWTALLGDRRGGPDVSPYAAPARATDLSGLPPAFLDVGSAETFRDEVVSYATRLWQAGGQAELHVWPGGFHGFEGLAPQAVLSRESRERRTAWLRRVLAL